MKFIFFALIIFSEAHAFGLKHAPQIISDHVESKLNQVQKALAKQETDVFIYAEKDQTAYYLKRIRLQYAPFVAFDVAFFEMKIIPVLEFRWIRKNPEGWVNYRKKSATI